MNAFTDITQGCLTRQEKLIIFMRRSGKTNAQLAAFANVAPITTSRWLRAESLDWYKVEIMADYGIPREFLPTPLKKHGISVDQVKEQAET